MSVLFLQPGREEDYLPFLEIRKTPVVPLLHPSINISDEEASNVVQKIREVVLQDRALHDKAQRAFVSWVKAYSKHQASSIFRVKDLEWGELADAWGLLKLPKMPEAKAWCGDRMLGLDVDFEGFGYRDEKKEGKRREEGEVWRKRVCDVGEGEAKREKGVSRDRKKEKGRAWSLKIDARAEKEARREKKFRKRESERWGKMSVEEREEEREVKALVEEVKRRGRIEREDVWEGCGD